MAEKQSIKFNLFQWNTLNRKLADKEAFPYVEDKYLEWDYRLPLIKKILEENKGDIISLEEVGNFEEDFKEKIFEKLNTKYDLIYGPKPSGFMGSILAINKELFSIAKYENITMDGIDGKKSGSNTIFALINENRTNNKFIVIVVHLKAKAENENIRLVQIGHLMKHIEENYLGNYPIFILGDFNAEPSYTCIAKLLENEKLCAKSLFNLNELDFTTIKLRDVLLRRIIDYMFFIGKKRVEHGELNIISLEKGKPIINEKIGLPNDIFPSDHVFLKARVELDFE